MCACVIYRFVCVYVLCSLSLRFVWSVCLACIVWGSLCACVMCPLLGGHVCLHPACCVPGVMSGDGLCFPHAWLCGLVACGLLPPSGHVLQCLAEVQTALKLGPGLGPPRVGSRAGGPHVACGHSTWDYVCSPWQVVAAGASGVCLCALTCPMPGYMGVWLFTRTRSCVHLSERSVCNTRL